MNDSWDVELGGDTRRFSAGGLFMTSELLKTVPTTEVLDAVQAHLREVEQTGGESFLNQKYVSTNGHVFYVATTTDRGLTSCYLNGESSGF